ncbi:hypothetical protein Tco_0694419 [Tanacetum coccineum]
MSSMANTTPNVTTVTKPATKEKTPKDADATPRTLSARYCNPSERLKVRDRLRYNDRHVLDQLGIVLTVEAALTGGTLLTETVLGAETAPAALKNHMIIPALPTRHQRWRTLEVKVKRHKSTDKDDLVVPWICKELKKQIEELVRAGKLSHLIKEIMQGRDQPKVGNKEVPAKDKSMAIYMIQPWHRMTRQKVTQRFEHVSEITFPSLTTSSGTEGPIVIEAEIGGHVIHRMYVDGGSSTEMLYEH